MTKPPKMRRASPSSAWETAIRLLSLRDRSEAELQRRLRDRGYDSDDIDRTLERCRACGYLDDARFARQRAAALAASGRALGYRLTWELKKAGVATELAETVAAERNSEQDQLALARDLLARRYPGYSTEHPDPRLQRRVFDFFRRRGFAPETIRALLHQPVDATTDDMPYDDL